MLQINVPDSGGLRNLLLFSFDSRVIYCYTYKTKEVI